MNRKTIAVVGLLMLLGSVPAASADHLSHGSDVTISQGPTESVDDRSVPGTGDEERETAYDVGTSTDCHDPSKDLSLQEAQDTLTADGFCGMLVYHEDRPDLRHTSQPDQHIPEESPIESFDVIRTRTYGYAVTSCLPFCQEGKPTFDAGFGIIGPASPVDGEPAFNAFHTVGEAAGLTEGPETAREAEDADDDRSQNYTVGVNVVNPSVVLQEEAPVWEYNGWWVPAGTTTFVAYVTHNNGQPLDQEDLTKYVNNDPDVNLDDRAEPTICGYTPDFQFTSVSPGAAGLNCEFEFQDHNPSSSSLTDDPAYDGYDHECESPTYVCGSQSSNGRRGAWYSQGCLCLGLVDPKIPGSDPLPIPDSTLAGPEGQTDYIRWHFVVAPHNSLCGGAQEPGFSFENDGGTLPYLAHDIDVYTTAASVAATDAGAAVPELYDYTDELAESQTEQVAPTIEQAQDDADELVSSLPGTPGGVDETVAQFVKDDVQEPNIAEPVEALDDTSRSYENGALDELPLKRSNADDPCSKLFRPEDEIENVDPWIDYIDSRASAVQDVEVDLTYASDERIRKRVGAYGTSDSGQDGTNRPGPSLYQTSGNVGMFTDTDNDGEYDALEAGIKYNSQNIRTGGAYPMMWNMWANGDGEVDKKRGCGLGSGGSTTMPAAMDQLGYGVNTGLAQAIYLKEPTAFVDPDTGNVADYSEGDNIYILMSQAAGQLWDRDGASSNGTLDEQIDRLVDEMLTYANKQSSESLVFPDDVEMPAEDLGLDAAFTDQCSGYTGNFDSNVQFVHDCSLDCSGDTIATMYSFELPGDTGQLEGSEILPTFSVAGDTYDFGAGQHTWIDVDPFDNDPDRTEQRMDPPPNPSAGYAGEGLSG